MTTQSIDSPAAVDLTYEIERAIVTQHDLDDAAFVRVRLHAAQILAAQQLYLVALGMVDAVREIWREMVLIALLLTTILLGIHYGAYSWQPVAGALTLVVWAVVAFVVNE